MVIWYYLKKIYIIFLATFTTKGESGIMGEVVVDDSTGEKIVPIELANHYLCHIHKGGTNLNKNEAMIVVAHKRTRVVVCSFKTSIEFLHGAHYVMQTVAKSFVDTNIVKSTKTVVKIGKGMCKVSGLIRPDTKIKHKFPVDDDQSWGKTTITINDWNRIIDELNLL